MPVGGLHVNSPLELPFANTIISPLCGTYSFPKKCDQLTVNRLTIIRSSPKSVFSILLPTTLYDLKINVFNNIVPNATAPTNTTKLNTSFTSG